MKPNDRARTVGMAVLLFAVWTLLTWWFEGRIETFLRPDAVADRLIYTVIANVAVGVVLGIAVVRALGAWGGSVDAAGFGTAAPSALRIAIALALGIAFYALQGAPSYDPIVLVNAFAQVLVTSAAEVVVCWSVLGGSVYVALRGDGGGVRRIAAAVGASVVASVFFGAYHYAHSAPFNTHEMVGLLSVVGLATSAFFFLSRDVYATIVFHNFLGVFGVVQALKTAGALDSFATIQPPLIITAVVLIAVFAFADRLMLRRSGQPPGHAPHIHPPT